MITSHCKVTGYVLTSADAFSSYKGFKKLVPTVHPIFDWSLSHLYEFLRNNRIKSKDTIERNLVAHAILRGTGLVKYNSPMFTDKQPLGKSGKHMIDSIYVYALHAFNKLYRMMDKHDNITKELLKQLPVYRVTKENCDDVAAFHNYVKMLAQKVALYEETGRTSDYDAAEDTLHFKLSVMGYESHTIEENDKLPKVFTSDVASWAAYQYCLATGVSMDNKEYDRVQKVLTEKVTLSTRISYVRTLQTVLNDTLPKHTDSKFYSIDKARSLLTLKRIADIISQHSKLERDLLGTEVEETTQSVDGVTWSIVEPVKTVQPPAPKPEVIKVNKSKLLQRLKDKNNERSEPISATKEAPTRTQN